MEDLLSSFPSKSDYIRDLQQIEFTKEHELDSIRVMLWAQIMVFAINSGAGCNARWKTMMSQEDMKCLYGRAKETPNCFILHQIL